MPETLLKKKYSTGQLLRTSLVYQARQFFDNSTLHGVRYIAEIGRPPIERVVWFTFVSVGTLVTLVIIGSLWEKFQTNPTITGLDTDFHNWDIIFPGVALCPSPPHSEESITSYVNKRWGSDISEEDKFLYLDYITQITNLSYFTLSDFNKFSPNLLNKLPTNDDLRSILLEVVKRQDEVITNCTWKDEVMDCSDMFLPALTENGFCYTFNSLLSLPNWDWKERKIDRSPKLIFETDVKWTISYIFNSSYQYKLYVYSHDILPGIDMYPLNIWDSDIGTISFSAKETYTTEEARQLTIKQRKCVFEDEIKLAFHPIYSHWACMSQCRMDYTMKKCSCVPFFYTKLPKYPSCDLRGLVCLSKYADDLRTDMNCDCHLGCKNTVYEVEKLTERDGLKTEIGFISWPMIKYKREVLFGWVDLLVSFGGIAGLFLGFSLLSAVELIYYFTLRAVCMVHKDKNALVKIQTDKDNRQEEIDLSFGIVKEKIIENDLRSTDFTKNNLNQFLLMSEKQNNRVNKRNTRNNKKDFPLILPYLD